MTMRKWYAVIALSVIAAAAATTVLAAGPVRRARPPKWDKTATDVFFDDARTKLIGPRPEIGAASAATPAGSTATPVPAIGRETGGRTGPKIAWSTLISAETLEDEIKRIQGAMATSVQSPTKFNAGGNKQARLELALGAALLGIIADYDTDVRWKQQAPAVRSLLARAARNCKVATDASFNDARRRSQDLDALVRGGQVDTPGPGAAESWDDAVERPLLMQRLDRAQTHGLAVWTEKSDDFRKQSDRILHEAQLIAALAEVIQRDGYEFADDETYRQHAHELQQQALAVVASVRQKNYEQARAAVGAVTKACDTCHGDFRASG